MDTRNDMSSASTSSQHAATANNQAVPLSQQAPPQAPPQAPRPAPQPPIAMAIPAPATKATPFEGLDSTTTASDMPYAVAQPTPNALPSIATARPMHGVGMLHNHNHHVAGSSNIPTVNGQPTYQHQHQQHLPHIATTVPIGSDYEHSPFRFMDKTRWVAGFMLMYYLGTFLFFQPFLLGTLGILTAFLGFYGARSPMDAVRMKWIRYYYWLNYVLIACNICVLALTIVVVALHNASAVATATTTTDGDNSTDSIAHISSVSAALIVALLVIFNVIVHVRGIQTSRAFYAELERAQVQHVQRMVVVMAPLHAV